MDFTAEQIPEFISTIPNFYGEEPKSRYDDSEEEELELELELKVPFNSSHPKTKLSKEAEEEINKELNSFPQYRNVGISVDNLTSITSFVLSGTKFKQIPKFLEYCTSLTDLDLGMNNITTIPSWLKNLPLTRLSLCCNKLQEITEDCFPETLEYLDLSANSLTLMSNTVLLNLKELNLSNNFFRGIPQIARNPGLKKVYLQNNLIQDFNIAKNSWKYLEILNLSTNHLTELPEGIDKLKNLLLLDVSLNRLTSVTVFPNLVVFKLSNNRISFIGSGIGKCNRLETLALDNNRLTKLPKELFNLELYELYLQFNNNTLQVPDYFRDQLGYFLN